MHGRDNPLSTILRGRQRYVDWERGLFSFLLYSDVPGSHHPTGIRFDFANAEFEIEILFPKVETLKKALMRCFDFVRTLPDFTGTRTHYGSFIRKGGHDTIEVVIGKRIIVRVKQSAEWVQLWIFGYGILRSRSGWSCDCGGNAGYPRENGFSSVHNRNFLADIAFGQQDFLDEYHYDARPCGL
jgi:hypothetical protein